MQNVGYLLRAAYEMKTFDLYLHIVDNVSVRDELTLLMLDEAELGSPDGKGAVVVWKRTLPILYSKGAD